MRMKGSEKGDGTVRERLREGRETYLLAKIS